MKTPNAPALVLRTGEPAADNMVTRARYAAATVVSAGFLPSACVGSREKRERERKWKREREEVEERERDKGSEEEVEERERQREREEEVEER